MLRWTSVEIGMLLCSYRAAYVSGTPAGRACASARLAGSILMYVMMEEDELEREANNDHSLVSLTVDF